ncbi:MAG: proton-conducting transporter membrane subunit, partial [Thermoplasmata archaeon]|nr:proton-conducting transporter membrane subunit [Thermoplasmata archaeon]
ASFFLTLWIALKVWDGETVEFAMASSTLQADALGILLALVATALVSMVAIYSIGYMKNDTGLEHYYPLLLLMVAGIVGIGFSTDFFMLFVFFEMMAVPSYALVTFHKRERDAAEAGVKYVILSAAGSAVALFGISLIYGQTGTLSISESLSGLSDNAFSLLAIMMLIAGFGVKAAIVPLHTWLPDAHSAAPSGISAILSGIVIQAGFIALFKCLLAFGESGISVGILLVGFALITMTLGNLLAFNQAYVRNGDLKRVLAYSSIAQMGYIILGIGLWMEYGTEMGLQGGLFHIMTHAFMKGLAFLCAGLIIYRLGTRQLSQMKGIGHAMPLTAFCFTIAVLSLAGAPPLSGFMSEWMIFKAGVDASATIGIWGILITLIAVLNSILSLGYYLPMVSTLFRKPKRSFASLKPAPKAMMVPIVILASVTIILGIWPEIGLKAIVPVIELLGGV